MKCFKKNKLELAEAKEMCTNVVDIINNKAICSDGKICAYSKNMQNKISFGCSKTIQYHFISPEMKELERIFIKEKKQ